MKKKGVFWLILVVFLGICAGVLRGIEVSAHFDWNTALYEPFATAWVLPVYAALSAALIGAVSLAGKGRLTDFCASYPIGGKNGLFLAALASLGLCAAGLWKLFEAMTALRAANIVFGLLTVLAGAVLLALAKARLDGKVPDYTRFISSLSVFWGCFLLVITYMEHPVEPVIRVFAYDILASSFIVLALFYMVAPLFRTPRRSAALFFTLGAVYLILLTIVGRVVAFAMSGDLRNLVDAPFRMIVFACMGVLLLQNAAGLLGRED